MQAVILAVIIIAVAVGVAVYYMTLPSPKVQPIKIGFIGNLSSPYSLSAKAAAQMAVDEINAAGGILGRNVTLIIEDSKGEVPKCVEVYKKLVMVDRVLAVIIGESVEMGVAGMEIGAELYPEYHHIFFSTIGSGDAIWNHVRDDYDKYKFGFQTYYYTSTGYLTVLAKEQLPDFFKNTVHASKVARINEDMEWTKPIRNGLAGVAPSVRAIYEQQGLTVVYETTVSLDQKMFVTIFEEIAAAGAEVIDCSIGYIDEAAFVKQWSESAAKNIPVYIWGGLAGMPVAWNTTEGKVLGVMVGSSLVRVSITDKTIPFMDNLVNKYGVGPIFGSHTTYDTIYGFKKAIETAGGVDDVEALIHALENVREVAVLGTIGWESRYHYNLPYPYYITPMIQWQTNGAMTVIWPTNVATGPYKSPAELRGG
jgi:branched-chain amino acid transport system substrate-binding protein